MILKSRRFGVNASDHGRIRFCGRQDRAPNLDDNPLALQHGNILLKVLSQGIFLHLISIGNVVGCNKNAKSKLQEVIKTPGNVFKVNLES